MAQYDADERNRLCTLKQGSSTLDTNDPLGQGLEICMRHSLGKSVCQLS